MAKIPCPLCRRDLYRPELRGDRSAGSPDSKEDARSLFMGRISSGPAWLSCLFEPSSTREVGNDWGMAGICMLKSSPLRPREATVSRPDTAIPAGWLMFCYYWGNLALQAKRQRKGFRTHSTGGRLWARCDRYADVRAWSTCGRTLQMYIPLLSRGSTPL